MNDPPEPVDIQQDKNTFFRDIKFISEPGALYLWHKLAACLPEIFAELCSHWLYPKLRTVHLGKLKQLSEQPVCSLTVLVNDLEVRAALLLGQPRILHTHFRIALYTGHRIFEVMGNV
ncbi:hypothetical protein SDC9_164302 [bioreactor metagenome]|uniref:Uncharacterized protein n=1 Tax=bioreactor metagenome TaxID=1076179 RepID=A0A645FYH2_9ZZZZ